jgi:hypothetical protein
VAGFQGEIYLTVTTLPDSKKDRTRVEKIIAAFDCKNKLVKPELNLFILSTLLHCHDDEAQSKSDAQVDL